MNVRSLLRRSAIYYADKDAFIHGDKTFTFEQCWTRGLRLANGLLDLGLQSGDHIAVLEYNSLRSIDFFLASAIAGFVRVPLYPKSSPLQHKFSLELTRCKALVCDETCTVEIEGLEEKTEGLDHIFIRDNNYEDWLAAQHYKDPNPQVNANDLYYIRFTGGTTGTPKGIPTTHHQFLCQGRDWFYQWPPVQEGDAALHVAPVAHASGMLFLPVWAAGGVNVIAKGTSPMDILDCMEAKKIAYLFLPPTLINLIAREDTAKNRDWSKLKVLMSAAAPIAENTVRMAREVFGDVLYQGYGQSESFPITMMGPQQWFAELEGSVPLRSAGKPLPMSEVEIWNDEGEPLPIGDEGEIVVRCDGQIDYFWENEKETTERIVNGFMRTGDIGKFDKNGYLYLLDRKNDMIISGGFNIYPNELESVICDHPLVREAAVVGIPHSKWGETPLVLAVTDEPDKLSEKDISKQIVNRLGKIKKPAKIIITTEPLPKTIVGKIDRKKIRAPYWQSENRKIAGV
jgi:acyl-CoA synthetase (AMP-forming)/AMP-acid ligase II